MKKDETDYLSLLSEESKKTLYQTPRNYYKSDVLFDFFDIDSMDIDELLKKLQEIKTAYSNKYDKIELKTEKAYDYFDVKVLGHKEESDEQYQKRIASYAKSYYKNEQDLKNRLEKKEESERKMYERLKKKYDKK